MLHGEHRRAVAVAASRPTDASRRRGQGGTRRCHRSSQPLETLFVRKIDVPNVVDGEDRARVVAEAVRRRRDDTTRPPRVRQ